MNEKCKKCLINKQMIENKEPSCCAWYIDNVVLGVKTVDDCDVYINIDNNDCKKD